MVLILGTPGENGFSFGLGELQKVLNANKLFHEKKYLLGTATDFLLCEVNGL